MRIHLRIHVTNAQKKVCCSCTCQLLFLSVWRVLRLPTHTHAVVCLGKCPTAAGLQWSLWVSSSSGNSVIVFSFCPFTCHPCLKVPDVTLLLNIWVSLASRSDISQKIWLAIVIPELKCFLAVGWLLLHGHQIEEGKEKQQFGVCKWFDQFAPTDEGLYEEAEQNEVWGIWWVFEESAGSRRANSSKRELMV